MRKRHLTLWICLIALFGLMAGTGVASAQKSKIKPTFNKATAASPPTITKAPVSSTNLKPGQNSLTSYDPYKAAGKFPVPSKIIHDHNQSRHMRKPGDLRRDGGGYFTAREDPQKVLTAYHSGQTTLLGRSNAKLPMEQFPIVRYNKVKGFNNNPGTKHFNQPTDVFMIKGTVKVSVVPMSPTWSPK